MYLFSVVIQCTHSDETCRNSADFLEKKKVTYQETCFNSVCMCLNCTSMHKIRRHKGQLACINICKNRL